LSPKMGISEFARLLPVPAAQVRSIRVVHHHRDDAEPRPAQPTPLACSGRARSANEPA
jgi:hypothetical protein